MPEERGVKERVGNGEVGEAMELRQCMKWGISFTGVRKPNYI
jgi:hypothetical protein